MYVFSKALHAAGQDIVFVRDRFDTYPISQPVWEDAPFTILYEDLDGSHFDANRWTSIERERHWKAPHWLCDPLQPRESYKSRIYGSATVKAYAHLQRRRNGLWYRTFEAISQADATIVCGINGALLAEASGLPYILWPHGGDIMLAAGFDYMPKPKGLRAKIRRMLLLRALRNTFVKANFVGSHCPSAGGGSFATLDYFVKRIKFKKLPIPYDIVPRHPTARRRQVLERLLSELHVPMPAQPLCGLVPSRVDYYWKGHDLFLNALSRRPNLDIHWLVSGWGVDNASARAYVKENKLEDSVTFLPFALSKPLLLRLMSASDLCVDQFYHGSYGTAALEAMAHGTPVMMWIDDEAFEARGWKPPPVLNAQTTDDIVRTLDLISSREIDLEERGRAAADWISRNHAPDVVLPDLLRYLQAAAG